MRRLPWVLLLCGVLSGCDTGTVDPLKSGVQVSFSTQSGVQVSFSTRVLPASAPTPASAPSLGTAPMSATGDTITDGTNTLIIDKAQLVLRKVELEPAGASGCSSSTSGCQEVEAGPVLVDLPLIPGAQPVFTIDAPVGMYREIIFEVHKVSDNAPDEAAFRAAHPELVGKSVLVQGRFNGTPFTYLSDVTAIQQLEMSPPLSVTATAMVNLTIRVSVLNWFRGSGGQLLDPASANNGGPNESRVDNNIKDSMKAFEDRDHDGDEHDG